MVPDIGPIAGRRWFWLMAGVTLVLLTWLGRGLTFWSDEWAFIEGRSLADPGSWWAPHNEHWSTVAVLAYRALVETIGLRTYVPYLLVVALLHLLVGLLTYRAVERRAGPGIALGAAAIVLLFGAGMENLLWGFQVGFVGAMLAGLVALDALDGPPSGRRAAVAAGALLVGVMTAGVGTLFVVAAGIVLTLTPAWRGWLWLLLVPALPYAVWFIAIGRAGVGTFRDPLAPSSIAAVPGYVAQGFGAAIGAATGLAPVGIGVAVVALMIGTVSVARGLRPEPRVVALLVAIAAEYALVAVTRAGITREQVNYPRYTYVSGILMVQVLAITAGPAIGRLRAWVTTSADAWLRVLGLAVAPIVLVISLAWNVQLLFAGRAVFLERASITRALVAVSLSPDPPPGANLSRDLILVPAPLVVRELVAAYGSPLADRILGWAVEPIPLEDLAEARRRIVEGPPVFGPDEAR